jgi:hypothetical protein
VDSSFELNAMHVRVQVQRVQAEIVDHGRSAGFIRLCVALFHGWLIHAITACLPLPRVCHYRVSASSVRLL